MDKRIKKLWVDALRSGDYVQGTHQLRRANKFCCLGVLCNIHAQEHPDIAATQFDDERYLGELCFTPAAVQTWADLHTWNIGHTGRTLIELNDLGAPFHKIADAIEKHF